jgi:hypothetical protein
LIKKFDLQQIDSTLSDLGETTLLSFASGVSSQIVNSENKRAKCSSFIKR